MYVYVFVFFSKKTKKNDFKSRLGSPDVNYSPNPHGKNVFTPEVLNNNVIIISFFPI